MEAPSWSSEPCQIVPSSRYSTETTTGGTMNNASSLSPYSTRCSISGSSSNGGGSVGPVIDHDSDFDLQSTISSYYDEFDSGQTLIGGVGGLTFDELFDNLVEKSKERDSMLQEEERKHSLASDASEIHVKLEETGVSDIPNCCSSVSQQIPSSMNSFNETNVTTKRESFSMVPTGPNNNFCLPPDATNSNNEGMELYHDLIMRHLIQDIRTTSNRLKISSDPRSWSIEHTQRWLADTSYQYNLPPVPLQLMNTQGSMLSAMELETLKHVYPLGAELIHAQLNLWTTASDYDSRCSEVLHPPPYLPSACASVKMDSDDNNTHNVNVNFDPSLWSPAALFNLKVCHQTSTQVSPYYNMKKEHQQQQSVWYNSPFHQFPLGPSEFLASPGSSDSGISSVNEYDENIGSDFVNPFLCHHQAQNNHHGGPMPGYIPTLSQHYHNNNIHLWQFLRELLDHQDKYAYCVRWIDRTQGIFKIEDSHKLAKLWGQRKNRPAMNYDKLSRSLRQYYRKGILKKTARSQRLVYQFLSPFHMC